MVAAAPPSPPRLSGPPPTTAAPVVEASRLVKVYEGSAGGVRAIDDVSLTVDVGEYVAVVGASGSGKSTFMNIVGCLDTPTSGEVRIDGVDVGSRTPDELANLRNRSIGFVFQQFNLLPRTTALENCALPLVYAGVSRAERLERAAEALRAVGLADRMDHMPNQLSGGQQQRVAIARALVTRPAVLLADEPTGALDSRTGQEVMEIFRGLNDGGMTIILVTHDHEVARQAERVIVFRDGRVEQDTCPRLWRAA